MTEPQRITSRANPLLVALRKAAHDGASYRRSGHVWLEGDHLCAAALGRGVPVGQALLSESGWARAAWRDLAARARRVAVVPDALFAACSGLESPTGIGFLIDAPPPAAVDRMRDAVVLDRVQDAGNVGSVLRSAAALGVPQVVALKGTAALWSPKVLRAGMGAHFALQLCEGVEENELLAWRLPLVATSSHAGQMLPVADLPRPVAWLLGHEGQGVSAALLGACIATVRIPQPGGEESLNVAAAAAICLYEGLRRSQ